MKYIKTKQKQLETFKNHVLYHFNDYDQEQREEIMHEIDSLQKRIDLMKEFFEDMGNLHQINKTTEETK